MIKCHLCNKKFGDGESVIPILRVTKNEKRGDFVGNVATKYIHLHHIKESNN